MQAVLEYLTANQARFLDELCEYVRIPSVSAQPSHKEDLVKCAEWLEKHCRSIGLETKLYPTSGNPILVAKTPQGKTSKPRFLVYGHYDVQPPEPFELWKTPPFEPRIEGRSLFGRGASDNKGQHLAHLNAIEAYLKTGTELPCDITFLIEGEEEVGSNTLPEFLKKHKDLLRCESVVVSDTGIPAKNQPALTYALRGIMACEVKFHGPSRDLHSGLFGGSLDNPAMALCQFLAKLRDQRGRVTIPGFYDAVVRLSPYEKKEMQRLKFNEQAYRRFLGVPALFGEKGFTPLEQRTSRPTLEINGLTSGYQGVGSKTIVPSWASAKLTMRLVPNQQPEKIRKLVLAHFKKTCPPTVRMEVTAGHGGEPYLVAPQGSKVQAALRALQKAFKVKPVLIREGGSIPIVTDFKKILGAETLLLGLAMPDDNAHSPNEKFDLDCFEKGMRMSAFLWPELSQAD
jgi:acetylornithine deacetylase/succinyl-diaminopimelate desuccinylase-like protein